MHKCCSCGHKFSDGATCSMCEQHFDFACAGISESGFRKLGEERRSTWRCPSCKSSTASPQPQLTGGQITLESLYNELMNVRRKLVPLSSLVKDIKDIKTEIANLQSSMSMAHEAINQFSDTVRVLQDRVKDVEEKTKLFTQIESDVAKLNSNVNDTEQWARSNNAEIKGIPIKHKENLFDIVINLGSRINFPIKKSDINYITRVQSRHEKHSKSIIISFINRYTKEDYIAAARKIKPLTLESLGYPTEGHVFVNEHLTAFNKNLLMKSKALAREKSFRFVWVKHGKIFVRKNDASPSFIVKTEKDLLKIA